MRGTQHLPDIYPSVCEVLKDNLLQDVVADNERKTKRLKTFEKNEGRVELVHSRNGISFCSGSIGDGEFATDVIPDFTTFHVDMTHDKIMMVQDLFTSQILLGGVHFSSRKDASIIALWCDPKNQNLASSDEDDNNDDGDDDDERVQSNIFHVMFANKLVLTIRAIGWKDSDLSLLKSRIVSSGSSALSFNEAKKNQTNLFDRIFGDFGSAYQNHHIEVISMAFRIKPIRGLLACFVQDEDHWMTLQYAEDQDNRGITFDRAIAKLIGCPSPGFVII